jgi:hypothetical protein
MGQPAHSGSTSSGLGLCCLVCMWSAGQYETGRFAAKQCKMKAVGMQGLSTDWPKFSKFRAGLKTAVTGSDPPLTTTSLTPHWFWRPAAKHALLKDARGACGGLASAAMGHRWKRQI